MTGVDISPTFIRFAQEAEETHPLGIRYRIASALDLPFEDASFDAVAAFMSLMAMPEARRVLAEVFRVLKPGGFLQFSITHPCFDTPHRKDVRGEPALTYAVEVGDYFRRLGGEVEEWIFSATPPERREGLLPFRVPHFTRPLSEWLNLLIDREFVLECFGEPRPSDEAIREQPGLQDDQVAPYFLHVCARKPLGKAAHVPNKRKRGARGVPPALLDDARPRRAGSRSSD